MSRFEFLGAPKIAEIEGIEERDTLIDNFLLEKSINILWGKSGLGKTWLCFGLCRLLASKGCDIVYLDADNGIDIVKDRGYDKVIKELNGQMTYINADFFDEPRKDMEEVFNKLLKNAPNGYQKAVFVLDSLTFFLGGSVYDESKIDKFVAFCKRLRRAGGTLIIIAHSTKGGSELRGSSNLQNAVDESWEVKKEPSFDGELNFTCSPHKRRLNVYKTGFNISLQECLLKVVDSATIEVKEGEHEAIKIIQSGLQNGDCSQNRLLEILGRKKNDRLYTRVLKRFDGVYWNAKEGKNRSIIYTLKKSF